MSGNVKECPVDGQELALVVENIALREQIGGLTVSELAFLSSLNDVFVAYLLFCLRIKFLMLFCRRDQQSN